MLLNSTVEPWVLQYFSHTPLIDPYKEITCTSRPKIPPHAHILPIWEIRSWDLKTLTQYHLYKEKPYAHGILVSPTPLYKQQASSYHRYMKILLALVSLSHGDSLATNLTIEGFLPAPHRYSLLVLCYLVLLVPNWCEWGLLTHWWFLCIIIWCHLWEFEWFVISPLLRKKSYMVLKRSMATINQETGNPSNILERQVQTLATMVERFTKRNQKLE